MREILETEEHVPIPPIMYSDPFYRITYLIKEEIRKYKWVEGEKGRQLTWEQARQEWTKNYQETYEKFLIDTLYFQAPRQRRDQRSSPVKRRPRLLGSRADILSRRRKVAPLISGSGADHQDGDGDLRLNHAYLPRYDAVPTTRL